MNALRSQAESEDIRLTDGDGNLQQAAHIGYNIRPGQGFNINMDIFNVELVAGSIADVKTAMNAFIDEAIGKAAEAGFPVGE